MRTNFGECLKNEREKKNITIEQVSEKIRIKKEFIKAIEEEDLNALPPEPFRGGFIKNYASFLCLNPEEIYDMYRKKKDNSYREKENPFLEKISSVSKRENRFILKFLWVLGVMILIVCFGIIFSYVFSYAKIIYETKSSKIKRIPVDNKITQDKQVADPLKLMLETQDKCWVKIYIDGTALFEGTLNEYQVKEFRANDKINIIIGNIYGIKMKVNGKDIDISKGSRGGVNNIRLNKDNLPEWTV